MSMQANDVKSAWATLLHAIQAGESAAFVKPLAQEVDLYGLEPEQQQTLLHAAALAGHATLVKRLLGTGADTCATDDDGSTALHLATAPGHTNVIKLLLAHDKEQVNTTDDAECTPQPGSSTAHAASSQTQTSTQADHTTAIRHHNIVSSLYQNYRKRRQFQHASAREALEYNLPPLQYDFVENGEETASTLDYITRWLQQSKQPTLLVLGKAGSGKSQLTHNWEQRLWSAIELQWHNVPCTQSKREYLREKNILNAVLYHQKQWWLSYQNEKGFELRALTNLAPYPFALQLLQESYSSLQMDSKRRKKITQAIQCYWVCQQETYLPIRIPLGDYNAETALNCVADHLQTILRQQDVTVAQDELTLLQKSLQFLYLLDGYDEIKFTKSLFKENIYLSNQLDNSSAKVLVTCRSEQFKLFGLSNLCFDTIDIDAVHKIVLSPLSLTAVQDTIELNAQQLAPPHKAVILANTQEDQQLHKLLSTPLRLRLYLESATPEHLLPNRWTLYQQFTRLVFTPQANLASASQSNHSDYLQAPICANETASAELAFELFEQDKATVANIDRFETLAKLLTDNHQISPLAHLIFRRKLAGDFGFAHESFKEFFIAQRLLIDLEREATSQHVPIAWNSKLLTEKPAILTFLNQAINTKTPPLQTRLKLILASWVTLRTASQTHASANAATLLVQLEHSFSNLDLSDTCLAGANLSRGLFDRTDFSRADCTGVDFTQAWLRSANFSSAYLNHTHWGEHPQQNWGGRVVALRQTSRNAIKLAAINNKHTIFIWDLDTERLEYTLQGHSNFILSVAFRHDGQQLVSASNTGFLGIWDLDRSDTKTKLVKHELCIVCLTYRPDGKQFASGGQDRIIRLWNPTTGNAEAILTGHRSYVNSLAYRGDGQQLASGSIDGIIRLWDLNTERVVTILEGNDYSIHSLAYRHDGQQLASGHGDGAILLWNLETNLIEADLQKHLFDVICLCYRSDGLQLASSSLYSNIEIWNLVTQRHESTLSGHQTRPRCLVYRNNQHQLISGHANHTTRQWSLVSLPSRLTLTGHKKAILSLAYRDDGQQLASSGHDWGIIYLWDLKHNYPQGTLRGHQGPISCLAYRKDNQQLASGSYDRTIRLWDLGSTSKETVILKHPMRVDCLAYCNNNRLLASASGHKVYLWDLDTGTTISTRKSTNFSSRSLASRPNSAQFASGNIECFIKLWNLSKGEASVHAHRAPLNCLAYRYDGTQLASGSWDYSIKLWNPDNAHLQSRLHGHTAMITCLAYHNNNLLLVSGSNDRTLRIWNSITYQCQGMLRLTHIIRSLTWHTNTLVFSYNNEILCWQTPQPSEPCTWYMIFRMTRNPELFCSNLQLAGATFSQHTRHILSQCGAETNDAQTNSAAQTSVVPQASASSAAAHPNSLFSAANNRAVSNRKGDQNNTAFDDTMPCTLL
jgi:WD40 repeat protein